MKSYGVYYLEDKHCDYPINLFDSIYMVIRDGAYIFYQASSQYPTAAYPVNAFYVLEVAE